MYAVAMIRMLKPPQLHNLRKISQPPVLMLMKQTNLFHFRIFLAILLPLLRSPATISGDVGGSISTDRLALLRLKPIMASNHVLDTNWTEDPPSSVCSWMGVSCTPNSNQRVQSLDLPGMGLQGLIPPELGRLSALVRLDLSNNSLEGGLPVEICNLAALNFLNLSKNNLSGQIPDEVVELQNLADLTLANNTFSGPIPKDIKDMKKLTLLDLRFNNLSGEFPGDSLESLWKLEKLRHLNVSHNHLKGKVPCGGNRMEKFPEDAFKSNDDLKWDCPFLYSAKRTFLFTCVFMGIAIRLLVLGFAFVVLKHVLDSVNSYKLLHEATNGFHENNLQPEGRFGLVYKGSLSLPNLRNDGKGVAQEEVVAVKVFNLEKIELKNFEAESKRLRWMGGHRNLAPVIGSCSLTSLAMVMGGGTYSEFKALVMKFMPNGSLEGCLHSKTCSMDINLRLEIMIGVASGLEYLHEKGLFHGDLKPSNVLLDEEMVAHLSDFGITKSEKKQPTSDGDSGITKSAKTKTKQPTSDEEQPSTSDEEQPKQLPTPGYSDPDYDPKTTAKSDIYSFGITLMETFTRKKHTDQMFSPNQNLRDWVKEHRSNVIEVVDAELIREGKEEFEAKMKCVSSVLEVALNCTEELNAERELENIKVVVNELKKIRFELFTSTSVSSSCGYQSCGRKAQENTS